jgi:hypothetical protein
MAQRHSGYERKEHDYYPTPGWVTEALLPFIPKRIRRVWEPAAGKGAMSEVLRENGYGVLATDINEYPPLSIRALDFLSPDAEISFWPEAIITNPPYNKASEFIRKSLEIMLKRKGFVAMILAENFDCAKSREDLFGSSVSYSQKIVLTKRIRFFPGAGSPSGNHCWYTWDEKNDGESPRIFYVY